jgi:multimeric flavodoxin WrbA
VKQLLIVWHSHTGGAQQMAEATEQAADAQGGTHVRRLHASLAGPGDLLAADGYLFVCPENLATMAGLMKDFFDRCYYPVLGQLDGRPYATLVCAGTDGAGAVRQIQRIATGWRLREVAAPVIVLTDAQTPEAILAAKTISTVELARCAEIGATLAAGLAAGVF